MKKMTMEDYYKEKRGIQIMTLLNPLAAASAMVYLDLKFEMYSDYEKVKVTKYGVVSNGFNEKLGSYTDYEWKYNPNKNKGDKE